MNPTLTLSDIAPELVHASRAVGTRRRRQAPNVPRRRRSSTEGHPRPVQTLRATTLPGGDPAAMAASLSLHDDSRRHESALMAALAGEEGYRRAPGDSGTVEAVRAVERLLHVAREEGCTDTAVSRAQRWLDRTTDEVAELLDHTEARPLTPLRCVCTRRYTLPATWRTDIEPALYCTCGRSITYTQWSAVLPAFADLRPASAIEHQLSLPATEVHRLRAAGYVEPRDEESGAQLFSLREVQQALLTRAAQREAAVTAAAATAAADAAALHAERVGRCQTARAEGLSHAEIALAEGVSSRTLYRWLAV